MVKPSFSKSSCGYGVANQNPETKANKGLRGGVKVTISTAWA